MNRKATGKITSKHNIALLLSAMLVLFFLTSCGRDTSVEAPVEADTLTNTDESLIMIGVSQVGSESVWRTANTNSIQQTFTSDKGYFLIFDNARQKQENQIKAIRSFISQQVDYIILSPITEEGWDTVLQEAKDAGIPVILFDRKIKVKNENLYITWVGSDFTKEGEQAGEWLSAYLEETGRSEEEINIVVLQGTEGATSAIGRTEGFEKSVANHQNWNILAQEQAEYTTTKGNEVMKKLLESFQDIDVVVAQNDDMMFGAVEALNEAGLTTGTDGEVIVISFDACRAALEMIQAGALNVDVECNPLQGPYIEAIIKNLEEGISVDRETYIPENVFDIKNIDEFINERTY